MKFECPYCQSKNTCHRDGRNMVDGRYYRRNKCNNCGRRFTSIEVYVPRKKDLNPDLFRKNVKVEWRREKHEPDNRNSMGADKKVG